jgi:hypothetical protein
MKAILLVAALTACSTAYADPAAPAKPVRFDEQVRQDFFDGARGDAPALARAIKACDDALAVNPRNAEALVWHGAAVVVQSSQKFRAGDRTAGLALYQTGMAEMDHAVELAPNDVGVRIPRGAAVLAASQFVPEPEKSRLLKRGVSDYETTLAAQQTYFAKLTLHAREQLLYGLTDAYATLGETDKARLAYERMEHDATGSLLLPSAKARVAGAAVDKTTCNDCHGR